MWLDTLTQAEFNTAYIAHIIADKPHGPRGDEELSAELANALSNLMLMCDEHHRLIDIKDVEGHPVDRLREMKRKHEERIELLTSIQEDKKSHILLYGANIGQQSAHVSWDKAAVAMVPQHYPAEAQAFEIGMVNSAFRDDEPRYWEIERENLRRQFSEKVRSRLQNGSIDHLSIFALAPQPLLMELGHLLSDIPVADVYQLHREPPDWKWQTSDGPFEFVVKQPENDGKRVALNLSLSATIDDSRIKAVLGANIPIWRLTSSPVAPNNDILKSREQLALFRQTFRWLMDEIKRVHGQDAELHVFPAVPVAIALEMGRVRMPKADLALHVYDQQNGSGFRLALIVG
ncbi:hypothetical protein DSCW_57050 [Desulfosarcina widdelii]|uniref:SMODS-associated and fused to various effectors domain-containing protein n=1 Tax=Desulfosarcina widdelii TaxID=947919 RepID=A0A5K7ZB17_9BACT|nr:hypothetical protein DSCW_57050 [Desulfosarcina widdelii]